MSNSKPSKDPSYDIVVDVLERRPRVVVLGHSFVRNLDQSIQDEIDYIGMRGPIDGGRADEGRVIAHLLRLSRQFDSVHLRHTPTIRSRPANGPHDIELEILALNILRPDICVIVLGSNDLTRGDSLPEAVADELIQLALRIRNEAGVSQVVLTSCLDRSKAAPGFFFRMRMFNARIRAVATATSGLSYYRIRGFSETATGRRLPVYVWSADGIHPNIESKYFTKFEMELRAAIMSGISDLAEVLTAGALVSDPPSYFHHHFQPPPPPPPGAPAIAA